MSSAPVKDIKKWIDMLTDRGITKFKYKDLPADLKSKRMLQKGRMEGLLRSSKEENALSVWEISYKKKKNRRNKNKK